MIQYENVKYFIDTHEKPGTLMACYLVHIKERQKSEYRVGVLVPPPINRNQRTRVDLAAFVSVERISVLCKPKHAMLSKYKIESVLAKDRAISHGVII